MSDGVVGILFGRYGGRVAKGRQCWEMLLASGSSSPGTPAKRLVSKPSASGDAIYGANSPET